jgi:sec-independent protein translocase protein TatA
MQYLLGFGMPGFPEMMIIMVVILVLFGGKQIPILMRNLGKGATEFKRGLKEPDGGPEPDPEPEPDPDPEAKDSADEPEEKEGERYDDDKYK